MADLFWETGFQFCDNSGDPLNAGTLNIYDATTLNSRTVYQDAAEATPWTQPITLNSAGRAQSSGNLAPIYVPTGAWKFILKNSSGSVIATQDNIPGAVAVVSATYAAPRTTILTKATDYAVVLADLGKKIEVDASGGDRTITLIDAGSATSGDWIIVQNVGASGAVILDGSGTQTINGALTQTLRFQYNWAILISDGSAWKGFLFPEELSAVGQISIDVVSATTTAIGAVNSTTVRITGTVTITGFGTIKAGIGRWVQFAAALTLTHDATKLILPGAANITTAAGDCAYFESEGSGNWRCFSYFRASEQPATQATTTVRGVVELATNAETQSLADTSRAITPSNVAALIAAQSDQETASSTALFVTPGRQQFHPSAAKGWVKFSVAAAINASYNVTSITDNGAGDWTVVWATDFSSANYCVVASLLVSADSAAKIAQIRAQAAGTTQVQAASTGTVGETDVTSIYVAGFGDQ